MDLEKTDVSSAGKEASAALACSICLDVILDVGRRSTAKLQCGHEFHLDCIGSAFNAKGAMQCPNCRKVEKGRWLYSNGNRSSSDFDIDSWVTDDIYDLGYAELPFGFQWLPFRGFGTQLASLFEEAEPMPSTYHEVMSNSMFRDHSSSSSNSHICPYLALHGFPNAMRAALPSNSADTLSDTGVFHQHATSMGGQSSSDMMNSHSFAATEPHSHNWQQHHSLFPLLGNADQSASQYGGRMSRNETNGQHRLGSFVHPHPIMHGSVARSGSNLVGSLGPSVTSDVRGQNSGLGSPIFQPSLYSSPLRSSPFTPMRRMRPRGVALVSSVVSPSSAEMGFYGLSVSGSVNRNHQEGDNLGRHDRFYGWGREGISPLPWIPIEGESHWWSPFNPNQNPQPGSFTQRPTSDRNAQNCPENGFQHTPPRLPPYM